MKLEIKHVKGYLGTEVKFVSKDKLYTLQPNEINYLLSGIDGWKLVLRPLSDLIKEIEHNGEKFVPDDELGTIVNIQHQLQKIEDKLMRVDELEYNVIQMLYEWHFDIHNLIENGHAININTLK